MEKSPLRCLYFDRASVEAGLRLREPYLLISISDPRCRVKPAYHALCRGVLRVAFHDAEPTAGMLLPPHVKLMTAAMARRIVRFVANRPPDVELVVVHCEQGASRSPAVAAAIIERFGDGDSSAIFQNLTPNHHVYGLTVAASEATRTRG